MSFLKEFCDYCFKNRVGIKINVEIHFKDQRRHSSRLLAVIFRYQYRNIISNLEPKFGICKRFVSCDKKL